MSCYLHRLLDQLSAGELLVSGHGGVDYGRQLLSRALSELKRSAPNAICFDLGTVEAIDDVPLVPELLRLPYPTTWFEYTTEELAEHRRLRVGVLCAPCEFLDEAIEVTVFAMSSSGDWVASAFGSILPRTNSDCVSCIEPGGGGDVLKTVVSVLGRFLSALHCCNVKRIEHKPANALNRARAKRNRAPIFSYWTLDLVIPKTGRDEDVPLGHTHASPRLHLRRGHVARSAASGRYWWVRPHLVGEKKLGMVHKAYALKPRGLLPPKAA